MNGKIHSKNIQDILSLTQMQKEILFLCLMRPYGEEYLEQQHYKLIGNVKPNLIEKSWNVVIENNEILRAVIRYKKLENPVLLILKEKKVPFKFFDFSNQSNNANLLNKVEDEEWKNKVDMETNPFRVVLCKLSETEYHMILSTHHIILDGWSNAVILGEFFEAYRLIYSKMLIIKKSKVTLKSYVQWLNNLNKNGAIHFWKVFLTGYSGLQNTFDFYTKKNKYDTCAFQFDKQLNQDLYKFIRNNKITMTAFFYCLWGIILFKLYDVNDVVFGVTLAGRDAKLAGINELAGLFIKTMPMRVKYNKNNKFISLLRQVACDIVLIEENQYVDLSDVFTRQELTQINFLNSIVVMQNYPINKSLTKESRKLFSIDLLSSRYSIGLNMVIGIKTFLNNIEIEFSYSADTYSKQNIEIIINQYLLLINKIIKENNEYIKVEDVLKIDIK